MSGHSKWSTIKRKKEANDNARGKLFSKLSRAITIAVKTGGGNNPETNYKLKIAIEAARAENMPNANVDRALSKADAAGDVTEITYEGFAPGGAGILVDVATDNRNRSAQEVKQIFEKSNGQIAGPGSVSYNFELKGLIIVKLDSDSEKQILNLIELGAEEVEEGDGEIEVITNPTETNSIRGAIVQAGYAVKSMNLIQKPKTLYEVETLAEAQKVTGLIEKLDDNEDVQNVFTNANISDEIATELDNQ